MPIDWETARIKASYVVSATLRARITMMLQNRWTVYGGVIDSLVEGGDPRALRDEFLAWLRQDGNSNGGQIPWPQDVGASAAFQAYYVAEVDAIINPPQTLALTPQEARNIRDAATLIQQYLLGAIANMWMMPSQPVEPGAGEALDRATLFIDSATAFGGAYEWVDNTGYG